MPIRLAGNETQARDERLRVESLSHYVIWARSQRFVEHQYYMIS